MQPQRRLSQFPPVNDWHRASCVRTCQIQVKEAAAASQLMVWSQQEATFTTGTWFQKWQHLKIGPWWSLLSSAWTQAEENVPNSLFLKSFTSFSWNHTSEPEKDEIQNTFADYRNPLSAGVFNESRGACGSSARRKHVLLGPAPETSTITAGRTLPLHKYIAQCHSNYACDEMQKLRQLLSCWLTFVGAFRADAFLRLYNAEHHTANKHTTSLKLAHYKAKLQ